MPTLGTLTVSSQQSNQSLAGRRNFLLKRALSAKTYSNIRKGLVEYIKVEKNQIVAVTATLTLTPNNNQLPLYINIITDTEEFDSLIVLPNKAELRAANALLLDATTGMLVVDSGSIDILDMTRTISLTMQVYFLDEYPKNIVLQILTPKENPGDARVTLEFFTDRLSKPF